MIDFDETCYLCKNKIGLGEEYYISKTVNSAVHIVCLKKALKKEDNQEAILIDKELHKENYE